MRAQVPDQTPDPGEMAGSGICGLLLLTNAFTSLGSTLGPPPPKEAGRKFPFFGFDIPHDVECRALGFGGILPFL